MTAPRLLVLCNAMDDAVRADRGIVTDSPAATRKIVMMMRALHRAGVRPTIVSLGRGRQDGSGRRHRAHAGRIDGIPTAYAPFVQRALLSQAVSLVAPLAILWRRRRDARDTVLLLYNRMFSHILAAWFARLLGYRVVLDLEDGETITRGAGLRRWRATLLIALIDRACTGGALLACRALAPATRLEPTQPYYGVIEPTIDAPRFSRQTIHALIGGTVATATGADMLVDAIERLRTRALPVHLHVTGTGDQIAAFERLAQDPSTPRVTVHGRLDVADYRALIAGIDLGFALKPNSGALADTTFPSKVVEMAGEGILVLTTDISDVRAVLGDGAVYLKHDDGALLAALIADIVADREAAREIARRGRIAATRACDPAGAGTRLRDFLFHGAS